MAECSRRQPSRDPIRLEHIGSSLPISRRPAGRCARCLWRKYGKRPGAPEAEMRACREAPWTRTLPATLVSVRTVTRFVNTLAFSNVRIAHPPRPVAQHEVMGQQVAMKEYSPFTNLKYTRRLGSKQRFYRGANPGEPPLPTTRWHTTLDAPSSGRFARNLKISGRFRIFFRAR